MVSMTSIMAMLYGTLLLQLACGADVSVAPTSDEETKQCLMQKRHEVSRFNTVGTVGNSVDKTSSQIAGEGSSAPKAADHQHRDDHKKGQQVKKQNTAPQKGGDVSSADERTSPKQKQKKSHRGKKHKKEKKSQHKKNNENLRDVIARKPEVLGLGQLHAHTSHTNALLDQLPESILALGWKLFKTEGAIAGAVENSVLVNVTHAGVKMSLMMNKFDDATTRLGSEGTWFSYDLDTLGDERENSDDMLNMLDIGGNYGVVTIAAMKKYGKDLRVVTVEPIPTTYFFLRWNLLLNGIPEIDEASLREKKGAPGVLALNSGSSDVAGKDLHVCSYPWSSMNSKVCDCPEGEDNCIIVPSTTVDTLASMFGSDHPIAMVKMDCEGCEFKSLPALAKPDISKRVKRLAGELHIPDQNLEEIACRWGGGKLMSKCQHSKKNDDDIECGVKLSCPL